MSVKYLIYTLNAWGILQDRKPDDKSNEYCFRVNLSSGGFLDSAKVISCDYHDDNALFYQILKTSSASTQESDMFSLKEKIVFVDFTDVFANNRSGSFSGEEYLTDEQSNVNSSSKNEQLLAFMNLFDPHIGLDLSFDGVTYRKYIPFDKSNSMARDFRITFIQADIKEDVDERLTLGIDFSSVPVNLSKYYSYRGLYLSTGYRIGTPFLDLNKESVIVVSDADKKVHIDDVYTVKDAGDIHHEFTQKAMDLCINAFDGEGIVSPLFAEMINNCLFDKYGVKRKASSFQIRLPFAKGMLHQVDFHELIREEFGVDPRNVIIKDIFGEERCLGDAHIIMTKSMLKCTGWLIKHLKNAGNNVDPMDFYFEQYRRFDHALYVTNTDSRLSNPGRVRLNHQFLSTLDLKRSEFDEIIQDYIDSIDGVARLLDNSCDNAAEMMDDRVDGLSEEYIEQGSYEQEHSGNTVSEALYLNRGFLRDYKVREVIKSVERGMEDNIALAKMEVLGEQRFLSSDLLSLVIHVLKQSVLKIDTTTNTKKTIKSGCFYMPSASLELEPGHNYAFLRNPHLSRNEQCILRYSTARESLYNKYFSHLTGIVMVSYDSIVPMALSGADFDGDIVKIIYDKRVIGSILRSCYEKGVDGLRRKLPVVVIQAPKGKDYIDCGSIPVKTVVDTFSNNVGLISNMALKYAEIEYLDETNESYRNKCAECTIVTGLEIDAAKTGRHPAENIEELRKGIPDKKNTFLEFKKDYLELKRDRFFSPRADIIGREGTLYLSKKGKQIKGIPLYDDDYRGSILSLIPGIYISYLCKKKNKEIIKDDTPRILFKFELNPQWKNELDKGRSTEVAYLIEAYSSIRKLERDIRDCRKRYSNSTFIGHITTLVDMKYDDHYQKVIEGISIEQAVNIALIEIRNCIQNVDDVDAAIKRLTSEEWHFSSKENFDNRLFTILDVQDEAMLSDSTRSFLYDFRYRGYMLLYYILQEIKTRLIEDIGVEEWEDSKCGDSKYYSEMKTDLICRDNDRQTSTVCEMSRKQICRKYLSQLFDNDLDLALKYVYAYTTNSKRSIFMWNIFDRNELLRNVLPGGTDDVE